MRVRIFGKETCEACKSTKEKFETFLSRWKIKDGVEIIFYDMDTADGLAEGAFNSVIKIPTTILEDNGKTLTRWDGKVPLSQEFKRYFLQSPKD